MRATEFLVENADQAAVNALLKKHGWSTGTTGYGVLYFTWQGLTYEFYGERMRINWPNDESVSVVWGKKPDWQGRGNDEVSFAQAVQRKYLTFDLPIWQALDRGQINDTQALQKFKIENERQAREAIAQGVTENVKVDPIAQPKQHIYIPPEKKTPAVVNHIKANEDRVGELKVGPINVVIDDHAIERTLLRNIDPNAVDTVLRKLPNIKSELDTVSSGEKIWVYDPGLNVALGLRRISGDSLRFVLKTLWRGKPIDLNIDKIFKVH